MTRIPAVYRDGVFVPTIDLPLQNETHVEVLIEEILIDETGLRSSAQRAVLRQAAAATMKRRKLAADAPRFSRDELHDRR